MASTPSIKERSSEPSEMELQAEIEHLKRHLAERDGHIEAMESEFHKGNTRIAELETQNATWREKYDRLYDSHRRVQRLNQNLEEKLLQMVDKCTDDKSQLTRDVETLSVRLAESNYMIGHLHKENERFKNDMNLAIQLLQCKPDNFVSQKFDSLPPDTQARVSSYIMSKAKLNQDSTHPNAKNSSLIPEKINPDDFEFNISASLMSKILEESVQTTVSSHCDTCTCLKKSINPFSFNDSRYSVSTQTTLTLRCFSCNSEITSIKSGVSAKCSPPPHAKIHAEEKDILQINDKELNTHHNLHSSVNKNVFADKYGKSADAGFLPRTKTNEEATKLVSLKHREIMSKIGDELADINAKDRYNLPSLEPMTGHHRLCDRTKPTSSSMYIGEKKFENELDFLEKSANKQVVDEPLFKSNAPPNPIDTTFGRIENSVVIPNISADPQKEASKVKPDFDSTNSNKNFHGSSISSNDGESKTSSNKSYQNNGSNNKVQIGPGPRFCSLIMQAGSKNILLDNAQPNIAPILYTRQARNMDTAIPLTYNLNNELMNPRTMHTPSVNDFTFNERPEGRSLPKTNPLRMLDTVENILDLPNEDLIREPIDLIEKPESGYKSNESAEIIDKILFGSDNIVKEDSDFDKLESVLLAQLSANDSEIKKETPQFDRVEEKAKINDDFKDSSKMNSQKILNNNLKIFNFDNYEKSLKQGSMPSKTQDNVEGANAIPEDTKQTAPSNEDNTELFNSNFDLKIASKNLSEIHKKFQNSGQKMPDHNPPEHPKIKEWKNERYTEKSSSSLSSDDSAAVLQKQQLIRVAEWVQKNLEMEQQQADFETSDSCHQSVEEMHHVRNDFPRPAKVDHRLRKGTAKANKVPHSHAPKHPSTLTNSTKNVSDPNRNEKADDENESTSKVNIAEMANSAAVLNGDIANRNVAALSLNPSSVEKSISEYTDTNMSITSKSYSREELARMEYNVKQFLLNGTRWAGNSAENSGKPRRTSSRTETDL